MATIADVRARAKKIVTQHKVDPRVLAEVALKTAHRDEQLAFELFRASKKAVLTLSAKDIESLLVHLHDWNSTDCFASFVSGVAWREGTLSDAHIHRWAKSKDLWTRRAAIVSTVPLNQNARGAKAPNGEAKMTLGVCALLVNDHEDMIIKAMSWALRTLGEKDPSTTKAFIAEHRERLAARVLRETGNKFETGLKNPKGKVSKRK